MRMVCVCGMVVVAVRAVARRPGWGAPLRGPRATTCVPVCVAHAAAFFVSSRLAVARPGARPARALATLQSAFALMSVLTRSAERNVPGIGSALGGVLRPVVVAAAVGGELWSSGSAKRRRRLSVAGASCAWALWVVHVSDVAKQARARELHASSFPSWSVLPRDAFERLQGKCSPACMSVLADKSTISNSDCAAHRCAHSARV